MATHKDSFFSFLLVLNFLFLPLLLLLPCAAQSKNCSFHAIYQFGDSISDTGNLIREAPITRLPYGETFFKRVTGRCSNGLLMVDYIALAFDLPFLNPYLEKDADFTHGVNFAVAGSTALDTSFLADKNIYEPVTNSSLLVQLDWFKTHLKSICYMETECKQKLQKALFLVGEIGGNDYNYAFFQGKTIEEVQTYVPHVVQNIKDTTRKVIDLGATRVVVPGNFPIGCLPIYLTAFKSNDLASYNKFQCLKGLNSFAMFHNNKLQLALKQLREEYSNVDIVYADYYTAFQWILTHAPYLGFEARSIQKACCGTGGQYNFNLTKICGAEGVPVCPEPDRRMSWDGIHLTQKAYKHMADWLIRDIMPKLKCKP